MESITNSWIADQLNFLWDKCPFRPENQPFFINPEHFYALPNCKDKVKFLMKRYQIPFEGIMIYEHSGLKEPGKVVLGKEFDTENLNLQPGQTIGSIEKDGTFSILDLTESNHPIIIKINQPLRIKDIRLSMFLNIDFINPKESMGAIIAHEVSHLYLYFKGLQEFDSSSELDKTSECLTDITAFIIGLGPLMLNGCGIRKRVIQKPGQIVTEETRLGYLSLEQMKFAQEQVLSQIRKFSIQH